MKKPFITNIGIRLQRSLLVPAAIILCCSFANSASAQSAFRSQFTRIWATVPVGATNSTVLGAIATNNTVILVGGATNANFDVTGLPAGAAAVLTDGNGNPLTSTTQSTNLWITLNTTNIPQGIYNFTLNIGGMDTNGLPVTNQFPFVLQSAHLWAGAGLGDAAIGISNNWANASSWLGGVPAATDDVVFADSGAQTNLTTYGFGTAFNVGIDTSMTVASMRFAQNSFTNANATNGLYHSIRLAPNTILTITGTNALTGFSLLRDTVAEFGFSPDSTMGVLFYGTNSTLSVVNTNANFSVLVGSSVQPSLVLSNLGGFNCNVRRLALSDFRAYPNYNALNVAYNAGRDTNNYAGIPRRFWNSVYLAKTNFIQANFVDPNNYTNEFTRTYALTLQNNEQAGNGSSVNTYFYLGRTNTFYLDSVCFVGASSASGNGGGVKYNPFNDTKATNPGCLFRGKDGVSRMSMFAVSDDGGTNSASSNVKSLVDFSFLNASSRGVGSGYIDLLADRLYVARDRTMITSNQTPNVQGDLIFGSGIVDVNTAFLGCQEHSNKVDWTSMGAAPYLNYCQGRLVVTNSTLPATVKAVMKVNGNLTLGYTADNNPVASAQQYNTYGQVTIYTNCTFMVSNVICDGGLNYYDGNGRRNTITINQGGEFIVTNAIGFPSLGASDFSAADSRGMRLDTFTIAGGGKLTVFVDPSRTNVFVRTLATPGLIPGVIKIAALTGVTNFPVQLPVISYLGTPAPFLSADVSALGAGYYGYVLNNAASQTVDVYITTNSPNTLVWTGSQGNHWNTNDLNWVTLSGNIQTNFHTGDLVIFNDSTTVTNVFIDDTVVPGQSGNGVTISNSMNQYVFSNPGGTIAGTAQVVKQGTNLVQFDSAEQGPITITAGTVTGGGQLGTTVVYSNVVLNFTGTINGGLTSTGMVTFAGTEYGPISIQGGILDNSGTMNTTLNQFVTQAAGTTITNEAAGTINVGSGPGNGSTGWDIVNGAVVANFGMINLYQPRMQVEGLLYGNGTINDPNGGGHESIANLNAPRILVQGTGVISPGPTPTGSIDTMKLQCRLDYNNDPTGSPFGYGTIRIEIDYTQPQNYDVLKVDRWNNDTGFLLMTNITPGGAGAPFTNGQVFQVFDNSNSGDPVNFIDTLGFCPTIKPYLPGPGLQWSTTDFNLYGRVGVTTGAMVWDGTSGGVWSTNTSDTSWKTGQAFYDNQGAVFDDSAIGTTLVNLITNVAPESYPSLGYTNYITNLDLTITTNIWFITNQPAFYPGIIVSNAAKNYVITGPGHIRGVTGLYKTGAGTLTLLNSNDFIGNVIIDQGVVAVTNYNLNVSILSLGVNGSGQMKNEVIMNGGALSYIGTTNVQLNHHMVLDAGGGTVGVASSTNMFTINNNVVGPGSLTVNGSGTLQLSSANNNYLAGTFVSSGLLRLSAAAVGYGGISMSSSTALLLTNNFTLTNDLSLAGTGISMQILGASTNVLSGNWSGSGSVTFSNANPLVFAGSMAGFSGTISFGTSSGLFQFNNVTNKNFCTGSAAATFDLGTGSATLANFNGSNLVYNLGALSGGVNTVLMGRDTNSAAPPGTTYSIGANGTSTTFAGKITNGLDTVTIVKVGTGSLLLNGINTYTGSTTVSNGVLGGTGSIASPLIVTASGTLSPGASIGTFTVSNNATLSGTTLMEINTSAPATNDSLAVTGTLTGGGVLIVTNVGPALTSSATFKLFSKPAVGFASVTLPAVGTGFSWNNNLAVDGTISLVSSVNPNPTNIVTGVTNGILTLSWPADHTGWRLQVQTNPLTSGLGTNWFTVSGSTNVNSESFNLDSNAGSIFYRLIYP